MTRLWMNHNLRFFPSMHHPLKTPFMTQVIGERQLNFSNASPSAPCPLLLPKLDWVFFPVSRPSPCLICFMQLAKVLGPRFATLASFEVSPCFLLCLSLVCYFIHYYFFYYFWCFWVMCLVLWMIVTLPTSQERKKKKKNNIAYLIDKIIPYQND